MAGSERVWTVIPAAGRSTRFAEAGFVLPKPYLMVRRKDGVRAPMLEHVLETLPQENVVIGVPRNTLGLRALITDAKFVEIENTIGQADTILQLLDHVPPNDGVIVADCDTLLNPLDVMEIVKQIKYHDVVVAVVDSLNLGMSRVDREPYPTRFVEKNVISKWGIVGVRGFQQSGDLADALATVVEGARAMEQEPYLSHAMNAMEGSKYAVVVKQWTDWGTPEALKLSGAEIVL